MLVQGLVFRNRAVPAAWPTRSRCDRYPYDFDASQRFTRVPLFFNTPSQAVTRNIVAPLGRLIGVHPFLPLIDNAAYAARYMQGRASPGPWVAEIRVGGIPFESAFNPLIQQYKSG